MFRDFARRPLQMYLNVIPWLMEQIILTFTFLPGVLRHLASNIKNHEEVKFHYKTVVNTADPL
jgi:hypothetical protein